MLLGLFQQNLAPPEPAEPGAWAAGSWAPNAWAGTAWGPAPTTIGTAWFATAWAPGAWGTAAWASTETAPPVIWDLDVPTLGPQFESTFSASGNFGWEISRGSGTAALSATFSASGDFQFVVPAVPFDLAPIGPVALSAAFGAVGDFALIGPPPFELVATGPVVLGAVFGASGNLAGSNIGPITRPPREIVVQGRPQQTELRLTPSRRRLGRILKPNS